MKYILTAGSWSSCVAQFIVPMTEREMVEVWLESGNYPALEDMASDTTDKTIEEWAFEIDRNMALKWLDFNGYPVFPRYTIQEVLTDIVNA